MSTITFYGGAGSVTGVNVLVKTDAHTFAFDCGLEQREDIFADTNARPFAYNPASVQSLFISHAHADHIGRVPKLIREGFRGTIYSTPATKDLSVLMFADALKLMEDKMQARDLLYDKHDIDRTMSLWETHPYHAPWQIADMEVEFLDAGHILGSALTKVTRNGRVLMFTGDLGNSPEPLLPPTEAPTGVNILIMESVYGDRTHPQRHERRNVLAAIARDVFERKGTLVIPSFSIERTQVILHELNDLIESGSVPHMPVFLDSPLAISVTEVFKRYKELFNSEIQAHYDSGDDPFSFKGLRFTVKAADSAEILETPNPKIVIAGSGMSQGGRIRHHERHYLPDKNAVVLFAGYQVPGSLGRRILDGAKHVEIEGDRIPVRAHVEMLSGYSGHKDREGLLSFVEEGGESIEKVFIAMGEARSSLHFAQRVKDYLGIEAAVPGPGESFDIQW